MRKVIRVNERRLRVNKRRLRESEITHHVQLSLTRLQPKTQSSPMFYDA